MSEDLVTRVRDLHRQVTEGEAMRRKAECLVRIAVEAHMGKANERDVGVEARKLIESLIGDLYSVRVTTYPPGKGHD